MFRNNFSSDQLPFTDTKADHHFPLEIPSSTKPIFLNNHDDFCHLDHHHHHRHNHVHDHFSIDPAMGVHIGSNFDSFDAFPYGSSSTNLDFYDHEYDDIKPFADHANIAHHQVIEHGQITMDVDFHQTGGGGCSFPMQLQGNHQPIEVDHSQDMAALHFLHAKPLNFVLPDELSCVTAGHDYYKKGQVALNNNIKHSGRSSSNTINNNNSRAPRSAISAKNRKKSSVVKGQWTTQEDRLLVQLVEQHGIRKWSLIAQMLPGRIGKQCRERWHNHLRPDIKKDTWSEEEDRVLIQAHTEIGNKWAEIAKRLPGRTENSIKNHWNATKRRQYSKRKCRSKYPRGSLLQDYIKSLNLDAANATTTRPVRSEEAKASVGDDDDDDDDDNANAGISNNVVAAADPTGKVPINDHLTQKEVEFCMDDRVVPDFDFDDMFQDGCYNVEALLDEIPALDEKPKWNHSPDQILYLQDCCCSDHNCNN